MADPNIMALGVPAEVSPVHIDLNLGLNVYTLGGRGRPRSTSVGNGLVAVAFHNWNAHDHQGFAEVYLTGEVIRPDQFHRGTQCLVVEIRLHPGTIAIAPRRRLCAISASDSDVATANLRYELRLEDPLRLVEHEPNLQNPPARQQLQQSIDQRIREELASVVGADVSAEMVWFWSYPDVRDIADSLASRLDRLLADWGLRIVAGPTAYRRWPSLLRELVLQFRAAEQELMSENRGELPRLGLVAGDLIDLRHITEAQGRGAGLFNIIRRRHSDGFEIDSFIEWLSDGTQLAGTAARFVRELFQTGCSEPDRERIERQLTEQVLLAAFRRQDLGLEWGQTEPRSNQARSRT